MTTTIGENSDGAAATSRRGFLGWTARAGVLTAGSLAGMTLLSSSASAHSISWGWSDNHTICYGCSVSSGNIVRLWQSVLWSARVSGTGSNCGSWVDGSFGPKTRDATELWQAARDLTADGIVGPNTWGQARSELHFHAAQAGYRFYRYPDHKRLNRSYTWFRMSTTSGVWQFQRPPDTGCNSVPWLSTSH